MGGESSCRCTEKLGRNHPSFRGRRPSGLRGWRLALGRPAGRRCEPGSACDYCVHPRFLLGLSVLCASMRPGPTCQHLPDSPAALPACSTDSSLPPPPRGFLSPRSCLCQSITQLEPYSMCPFQMASLSSRRGRFVLTRQQEGSCF